LKKIFQIREDIIFLIISILLFFVGIHLYLNGYPYGNANFSNWYVISGVILVNIMNIISNIRNKRKYAIIASLVLLLFCVVFLLIHQIRLFY
jgi:uncharacterized membrane protein